MSSVRNFKGFGDALINFLYSLAKSRVTSNWTGEKVSNYVLSEALIASDVKQPGGLDKHEKGDYVEGYIAEAWISGLITTEDAVRVLMDTLRACNLEEEEKTMMKAFRDLLNYIHSTSSESEAT